MLDSEDWIQFGEGQALIALKAAGNVEIDYPAHIRLKAGEIEGELAIGLSAVDIFTDALERLHQTLSGVATLDAFEEDFRLIVAVKPLGHLQVTVSLVNHTGPARYDFNYRFEIDQSYLPTIIFRLRRQFPSATPIAAF